MDNLDLERLDSATIFYSDQNESLPFVSHCLEQADRPASREYGEYAPEKGDNRVRFSLLK